MKDTGEWARSEVDLDEEYIGEDDDYGDVGREEVVGEEDENDLNDPESILGKQRRVQLAGIAQGLGR